MFESVLWALGTGVITGGVGALIVMGGWHRKFVKRQEEALRELSARVDRITDNEQRLAELEERVDFAERRIGGPGGAA
jgi:hypothetical protein